LKNLLLLFALLAGGCKIVVEVPEGGSITTESGAFTCAESATCEIDVDDADFEEAFVAVPAQGYEFLGWKQRDLGLCGVAEARLEPCTISTLAFVGNPAIQPLLEADLPVYLEPEFAPAAGATILFPVSGTGAVDSEITVRGTAYDPNGVASITVNGHVAGISGAEGSEMVDSRFFTTVDWVRQLKLGPGTTELVVDVIDAEGNLTPQADTASIDFLRVPARFHFDPIRNRLIGRPDLNGFSRDLIVHDLNSGTQTFLEGVLDSLLPACYKPDTDEYLYLYGGIDHYYEIRSINVATGGKSIVAAATLDPVALGFTWGPYLENLACASGDDAVYLTYGLLLDRGPGSPNYLTDSYITKFDLNTGQDSLLATFDSLDGDASILGGTEVMGDKLVAYPPYGNGRRTPLYFVDKNSGAKSVIEGSQQLVADLAVDPETETIYVMNFDAVYRLDAGENRYRIQSFDPTDNSLDFTNPHSAALDTRKGRLLVGDGQLNMVVGISLANGKRTEVVSRRLGTGTSMASGWELYVTEDQTTAYVADDGALAAEKLFRIDLATGDRHVIGNILGMDGLISRGLTVDEENNKAYVAFSQRILEADLASEQFREIAGPQIGFGPTLGYIFDLVLDRAHDRLLIADIDANAIYAMDLRTRVREVFSQYGSQGDGEAFSGIVSMIHDAENNRLFVANRGSSSIMMVDLDSGDREVILESCLDEDGRDVLGNFNSLEYIGYGDGRLVIIDSGIKVFDLNSGECSLVSYQNSRYIKDLSHLDGDLYFAVTERGLGVFDSKTNELVYISE
jgi:DNA-binding beta-propeller fold protein YncE